MVLNPEKGHSMLFGVKENERFHQICNNITVKHSSHADILGVTIGNTLFFDKHINNICKTPNKKLSALCRINYYMKKNRKKMSYFIISYFSYCLFIWMFLPEKSSKRVNVVLERSLGIDLNDYESPYTLLLQEVHQKTFHQRCIYSIMVKIYKYLNRH